MLTQQFETQSAAEQPGKTRPQQEGHAMGEAEAGRKISQPGRDAGESAQSAVSSAYDNVLITTVGLSVLCDELATQGFDRERLLAPIGLAPSSLDDPESCVSLRQKVNFLRNIHRLTRESGVGLRAGQRHRIHDLGVYGFAVSSCPTLGDALRFGLSHSRLAGSVIERRLQVYQKVAVVEAHDVFGLHEVLPLAAEFAFSTMQRIASLVTQRPFKPMRVRLPYPAPSHASAYADLFGCSVDFGTDVLEFHIAINELAQPSPNASLLSERISRRICEGLLKSLESGEPAIVRAVRTECFKSCSAGNFPTVNELAARLRLSRRTLARRIAEYGISCQDVIDDVRARLAKELLGNTGLSVDEVGVRLGFSDVSNFSKAFKRWTAETPAEYRKRVSWRDRLAGRIQPECS